MSTVGAVTSLLQRPTTTAREAEPPTPLIVRIVGVSFCEGYPTNLLLLAKSLDAGESASIQLLRQPDNRFDPNAVAVICVAAGGRIGMLSRREATRMAPRLDTGVRWRGEVQAIRLHPSHLETPGATIRCWAIRALTGDHT